jgi:hypothetical protein
MPFSVSLIAIGCRLATDEMAWRMSKGLRRLRQSGEENGRRVHERPGAREEIPRREQIHRSVSVHGVAEQVEVWRPGMGVWITEMG